MKIKDQPLISVIIPVYNAGKYLDQCLETLLNQTLKDIEIICVLDCPTDGSDIKIKQYAEKDSRIKVLCNKENLNIGQTRNRGINAASGIYIGFSDHDDYRELNMYEDLYNIAKQSNADIVFSGNLAFSTADDDSSFNVFTTVLSRRGCTHVTPNIYKRSFITANSISFVDNNVYSVEDTLFNVSALNKVILQNGKIKLSLKNYYTHVDFIGNQNKSYYHWAFHKVQASTHYLFKLINTDNLNSESRDALFEFTVKSFYTSFLRECKKNGFIKTLRLFHQLKRDESFNQIIQSNHSIKSYKNLKITKKIFAIYLHCISQRTN